MKVVTRICALPADMSPHAKVQVLHEWPGEIPYAPEGGLLQVGQAVYRVRYRSVLIDEQHLQSTVVYAVQDWRERVRI